MCANKRDIGSNPKDSGLIGLKKQKLLKIADAQEKKRTNLIVFKVLDGLDGVCYVGLT